MSGFDHVMKTNVAAARRLSTRELHALLESRLSIFSPEDQASIRRGMQGQPPPSVDAWVKAFRGSISGPVVPGNVDEVALYEGALRELARRAAR